MVLIFYQFSDTLVLIFSKISKRTGLNISPFFPISTEDRILFLNIFFLVLERHTVHTTCLVSHIIILRNLRFFPKESWVVLNLSTFATWSLIMRVVAINFTSDKYSAPRAIEIRDHFYIT